MTIWNNKNITNRHIARRCSHDKNDLSAAIQMQQGRSTEKTEAILAKRQFVLLSAENGKSIWRRGSQWMNVMRFIELKQANNILLLSAWVKADGNIKDFSEHICRVPKKQLLTVIEEIKRAF